MDNFKPKNLFLIQVLRGIASLLVVLLHATTNLEYNTGKDFLFGFFGFGGSGVDMFFVLSGFIITYTSRQAVTERLNFIPFLRRRFVRIYPVYWIIISFFLFVQVMFPSFYGKAFSFDILNLLSTYLLLPGHVMVNGVSWTLSTELFFYVLFSLAFFVSKKQLLFAGMFLYTLIIISAYEAGYTSDEQHPWISLLLFPMNIEFFLGIIAAAIAEKVPLRYNKLLIIIGTFLFLLFGVLQINNVILFKNEFNRVIYFGLPSFLIITGVANLEIGQLIKRVNKLLLSLGDASYSLYLLHLPVMAASTKLIAKAGINNIYVIHVALFLVVIIVCYASIIFYKLIEMPLIRKLNYWLGPRTSRIDKYA